MQVFATVLAVYLEIPPTDGIFFEAFKQLCDTFNLESPMCFEAEILHQQKNILPKVPTIIHHL